MKRELPECHGMKLWLTPGAAEVMAVSSGTGKHKGDVKGDVIVKFDGQCFVCVAKHVIESPNVGGTKRNLQNPPFMARLAKATVGRKASGNVKVKLMQPNVSLSNEPSWVWLGTTA